MKIGSFNLVLHAHIPYCRNMGKWPHGEEWLHEAIVNSYIPLLMMIHDLSKRGCPIKITISFTPVLLEQMHDNMIINNLLEYIQDKIDRCERDIRRFRRKGELHLCSLAEMYYLHFQRILTTIREHTGCDIIEAFKYYQDMGYIEISTSAATHAYLPLLKCDSSIYAQLKTGKDTYIKYFKKAPLVMWLPECGYRPQQKITMPDGKSLIRKGIEKFLEQIEIHGFVVETHLIEGSLTKGKVLTLSGQSTADTLKKVQPVMTNRRGNILKSTFLPYFVGHSHVAVMGRDSLTGKQVWSADWGYPGDYYYREFHKKDDESGMRYWRITGKQIDLGAKEYYDPHVARQKIEEHSNHFVNLVEETVLRFYQNTNRRGAILAAYDTELFGHWWFEGVNWLSNVIEKLWHSEIVELNTFGNYLYSYPPQESIILPAGSWGLNGDNSTWDNPKNSWMLPVMYSAECKMEEVANKYIDCDGLEREALNQAARELLLLQSSDWAFLITTGQASDYAIKRFGYYRSKDDYAGHVGNFFRLIHMIESKEYRHASAESVLKKIKEDDCVFSGLDYRLFKKLNKSSINYK